MAYDVTTSPAAKDNSVGMWIALGVFIVLGMVVVAAGVRIAYVMGLVNYSSYREPVLIAHGVADSSDVEIGRMVASSKIYLFMAPWPEALPSISAPTYTAADPLPAPVDNAEAAALRTKATAGDVAAASALAKIYYTGRGGVRINFHEAARWFQFGAAQGDAYCEDKMGEICRDGYIVTADEGQAAVWFRKAAAQGWPDAQDNLAWMYFYGEGVTKDEAEARKWVDLALPGLHQAADAGDPEALGDLGDLYVYGLDVATDDRLALSYYQKAADARDAYCEYGVGTMYEGGLGVPVSIPTAVEWYQKAAAQGLPNAQLALKELGE